MQNSLQARNSAFNLDEFPSKADRVITLIKDLQNGLQFYSNFQAKIASIS